MPAQNYQPQQYDSQQQSGYDDAQDPNAPQQQEQRYDGNEDDDDHRTVPDISLVAPSPDLRPHQAYDEQQPVDDQTTLASADDDGSRQDQYDGAEVYGQLQEREEDDYFEEHLGPGSQHGGRRGTESGASTPPAARSSGAAGLGSGQGSIEEYGFDDSAVFDGGMSASTSGSTYGEWTGQSDANEGYDYVTNQQDPYDPYAPTTAASQQQQQQPQDPYQPQDGTSSHAGDDTSYDQPREIPSRESTYTPPDRTVSHTGSPVKQSTQLPSEQNYDPYAPTQSSNREPAYEDSTPQDAYAPQNTYAPQEPYAPEDAYAPQGEAGDDQSQQQQQPQQTGDYYDDTQYSPYDPNAPARRYSDDEDDGPYNPYTNRQGLSRQMSTSSFSASAAAGAVPCDLGWEQNTAPIVSFGFGGRMLLVFPSSQQMQPYAVDGMPYGSAPSTSTSSPSTVHVRKLVDILSPPDALTFPGPLYLDGGKSNIGKKRKDAVTWLDKRAEELEKEVQYARSGAQSASQDKDASAKRRKIETRLVLVKLVKVLVENEGKLGGT